MYPNTRIFPTSGYAQVLLFMFIRRELGGMGTGCLFQFTYCGSGLLLFVIGKNRHGIGKKCGYFPLGMGPKFSP